MSTKIKFQFSEKRTLYNCRVKVYLYDIVFVIHHSLMLCEPVTYVFMCFINDQSVAENPYSKYHISVSEY